MSVTPLRARVHEIRDGVRLLQPDPDIPYRDGAEDRLWEIVHAAQDISSDSSEMLAAAQGWAQQYHTHPSRANILRALDIRPSATVLEIGAGCGPITRYLGETGAQVDSVEPVLPRARVGRERTRDQANVEVFCGSLDDVPNHPAYDLVVVVGVLEYVGGGTADPRPYLDFLGACRRRVRPGGCLVLAIENKLGVKYLTGTGEDHSGRIFDSIEDYPRGSPARTFGATALADLVTTAGFEPRVFGVFPDYKHTRVVFDADRVQRTAPDLLGNLPTFPSRFAGTRSLKLASEERVWKELARDGVGAHFCNSFLVIGSTETPAELWPDHQIARYFSINRRREYAARTSVVEHDGAIRFERTYGPQAGPLVEAAMTGWDYAAGRGFLEVFYEGDDPVRQRLLRQWVDLLHAAEDDVIALDAIPTNLVVSAAGSLELIDSEFHDVGTVDRVVVRGLFWMAFHLARTTPPESWSPDRTVGQILQRLAGLADVEITPDAVDRLIEEEASLQVAVSTHYLGPTALVDAEAGVRRVHDTWTWDNPLGRRLHHEYDDSLVEQRRLRHQLDETAAERDQLREGVSRARAKYDRLRVRYEKAVATNERLGTKIDSHKRRAADLRRAERRSRTRAARAERQLSNVKRSRTYKIADRVRRGFRKIKPRPWPS